MTWWRQRSDRLDDEIQKHIDFETEQNMAAGMPPEEARSAALRKFGNVSLAKEEAREVWGWLWLERLWQDTVYGLRGLVHTPGFTIVALLSLMLGIGASTSLFSVIYGVLIAPYPYKNPDQIWAPAVTSPKEPSNGWHQYRRRELLAIRNLPGVATAMATTYESTLLTGTGSPESFYGVLVTGNAFDFLGVKPLIGRTIEPFDIRPDGTPEPVVVLNYRFWQRKFNGDINAIGQKLILNDVPRTVIGVMPPRFGWFTDDAFWLPMSMDLADETPLNAIVRLRPGVTKEAAEQQLHSLNVQLAAEKPQNFPKGGFRSTLLNYLDITVASGAMKSSLHLLLVAVGFLLLIACVNVANLQLARTTARAREIAVRLSVGASRPRLIRQLLTESVLLSALGGALGIFFAIGATRAIAALMPDFYKPNEARIAMNVYVLLFSLGVSLLTGILFGLAPALRCSRPDLAGTLKDGGRGAVGSASGQKVRGWLVAAEVALSVILLAGASLAIRSFAQLSQIDPGFQPQKTLMVDVPLPPKRYATLERRNTFARSLLESVSGLPGVEAVALGNGGMPFGGPRSSYSIDGQLPAEDRRIVVSFISSDYPRTLGIPLKRGRMLTAQEVADGTHVALINQTAAKLWAGGESPIGRRIRIDLLSNPGRPQLLVATGSTPDVTIVGILGDTTNAGLREATLPGVYVPYTLLAPPSRVLALRTFGDPMTVLNAVRQKVRELDKDQPLSQPITLKEILGFQTVQPRFNMALFSTFAALGLALAAIGIYSVISYGVAQRMHEIGVRMALGARRGDVLVIVLRMVAKVAAIGLAIGLVGSVALERIVRFQVFAATSFDAVALADLVIVLSIVALLAAWLPARRAAHLDPVAALRHEA